MKKLEGDEDTREVSIATGYLAYPYICENGGEKSQINVRMSGLMFIRSAMTFLES